MPRLPLPGWRAGRVERPAVHAREHEALPAATLLEACGRAGGTRSASAIGTRRLPDLLFGSISPARGSQERSTRMSPCSKSRCNQSSACSSPRRSPAYSAVAHTADRREEAPLSRAPPHSPSARVLDAAEAPAARASASDSYRPRRGQAPADRSPATEARVPDSARRTPLPNHPVSEILNLVPRQARETYVGERGKHTPTQIPLITAKRRRLIRRPRTRTNKTRLRRSHPLLRSLANRHRTRSAHRLPANSRLTLLTPNTRLRQRPKRPPNRLPVPPDQTCA